MKTFISICLCFVIFFLGAFCGFFVSNNLNKKTTPAALENTSNIADSKSTLAGTYKANNWYGGEATVVLYDDGTYIAPFSQKGTWSVEDKIIHLTNEDATIVPKGIMLRGIFFEKL